MYTKGSTDLYIKGLRIGYLPFSREVARGGAVSGDAAGGGDVVGGDRVAQVQQDVRVFHSGHGSRVLLL